MSHPRQSSYTIHPVQPNDVESVMALLRRTFFLDEPLNAALGLCNDTDVCPEVDAYCRQSLLEGLSFKATDSVGNIIAVTISGLWPLKEENNGNDLLSQAERCSNPKFKKILYILARREEGARLWEKFPQEQSLVEVKVAATDQQWRRRGIMNQLLKMTEKATEERGIKLLRIDTSSAYSAMAAERLGFTCYYSAPYTDIKMDGKPLVVPQLPHVEDRVYVKKLRDFEGST